MATLALTAALVMPIHGHTVDQLEAWQTDWTSRAVHSLDTEMMNERRSILERHPWHFDPISDAVPAAPRVAVAHPPSPSPPGVEAWRPLVAEFFPADLVDLALKVMGCESGGDPWAANPSGASGLFQHMPEYWAARSSAAGWPGTDIFDPRANVAVAAFLATTDGWRHWNPSRWCWS